MAASFSSSEEFDKQAYRRSDALEERRKLMEAWAAYCEKPGGRPQVLGDVQELARLHARSIIDELARLALKAKSETNPPEAPRGGVVS